MLIIVHITDSLLVVKKANLLFGNNGVQIKLSYDVKRILEYGLQLQINEIIALEFVEKGNARPI